MRGNELSPSQVKAPQVIFSLPHSHGPSRSQEAEQNRRPDKAIYHAQEKRYMRKPLFFFFPSPHESLPRLFRTRRGNKGEGELSRAGGSRENPSPRALIGGRNNWQNNHCTAETRQSRNEQVVWATWHAATARNKTFWYKRKSHVV
jgi:hypothetical protein